MECTEYVVPQPRPTSDVNLRGKMPAYGIGRPEQESERFVWLGSDLRVPKAPQVRGALAQKFKDEGPGWRARPMSSLEASCDEGGCSRFGVVAKQQQIVRGWAGEEVSAKSPPLGEIRYRLVDATAP